MNTPHHQPAPGWDCHVHVFQAQDADRRRVVHAGHYQPANHPLADIEAVAAAHQVRHLVLVQPSVYGHDNTLVLNALAQEPGRHRAVVVLANEVADAELDAMHAAGVRGARFNRVSPVGESSAIERRFDALAPRLLSRGWHLQWYVHADQVPQVAALHAGSGLTCVLDHLGGVCADTPASHPAWPALASLSAARAWIKLSGWYRLKAVEPYDGLQQVVRRMAALFEDRMVWGSDWPHTAFAAQTMPRYDSTWQPVVDALGLEAAGRVRNRLPTIYA